MSWGLSATIEDVHMDLTIRTASAISHKFGPGSQGFPIFIALLLRFTQQHEMLSRFRLPFCVPCKRGSLFNLLPKTPPAAT